MEHSTIRQSLYSEVTSRFIAELEQGRLPWVQPWDTSLCGCTMPHNAATDRRYSGINVLILWAEVVCKGYGSQRWLTYRQAQAAGGNVRKGEKGTTVCYADRFMPKAEAEQARGEDREARTVAFLKRFTVFNIDQCEGLPEDMRRPSRRWPWPESISRSGCQAPKAFCEGTSTPLTMATIRKPRSTFIKRLSACTIRYCWSALSTRPTCITLAFCAPRPSASTCGSSMPALAAAAYRAAERLDAMSTKTLSQDLQKSLGISRGLGMGM
jgi:hypothetical protein